MPLLRILVGISILVLLPDLSQSFVVTTTTSTPQNHKRSRRRIDAVPSTSSSSRPIVVLSSAPAEEEVETVGTTSKNDDNSQDDNDEDKKSFWMPKGEKSRWQERLRLEDLQVGQELYGHVVQELLDGKTGPKLFLECGVGRIDKHGDWQIVTGMLRLPFEKASVTRKRVARLRKNDKTPLFVSRIQKECGRLEVCASREEVDKYANRAPKIPVHSLQPNQIVEGTVLKLYPYGATVDIGANRRGLLHITKVAALYGRYIDKEAGLVEAGVEKGARVKLMVESVIDRRISLDFTPDVKKEAQEELAAQSTQAMSTRSNMTDDLSAWEDYANLQTATMPVAQNEIDSTTDIEDLSNDDDEDDDDAE
jgi:predicted RNA-binding protein with RPS1 domain